jgi:pterin-4a-carbinolamine dehydratase
MNTDTNLKSILLLSANPKRTKSLRLQEEEEEIKMRLRLAGYGKVPINSRGATKPRDIQQAMLDFKPQIVHFSGHGAGEDGLVFEDAAGEEKLVSSEALANLFELFFQRGVECVVLNACYAEFQARAIAQHIPYVIGMNQAIGDRAAIEFAVGFYTAVGAGETIEFAYKLGCNTIQLEGIAGHFIPVLFIKDQNGSNNNPSVQNSFLSVYPTPPPEKPEPISEKYIKIALKHSLFKWKKVVSQLPEDPTKERIELFRQYNFKTFLGAIEFMRQVAPGCDIQLHHPRWENIWCTLRVYLTTWDIGHKISDRDIQLAKYLDQEYSNFPGADLKE